ncbi:MAG: type II secretion system protein [Anaeromyxobacter sp.]
MRTKRGFTLIEVATVLAIAVVLATLAYTSLRRSRPRADLLRTAVELRSLVAGARQQALLSGRSVAVLIFPDHANPEDGKGRVIVVEDPRAQLFLDSAPLNFGDTYDPATPAAPDGGELFQTMDLPHGVVVGPVGGLGAALPAPDASIPDDTACTFCSTSGDHRGAIVFDGRGRARFYSDNGAALDVAGGTLSVTSTDLATIVDEATQAVEAGPATGLVIRAASGSLRTVTRG